MRCDDVIRELSVPTGDVDPAAVAEHLDGCPRCASWAKQSAQLDRLWDATRPPEPSPAAWNRIWANVSAALDHPAAPTPAVRPWRKAVLAGFMIAQAAALLAAFTIAWRGSAGHHAAPQAPGQIAVVPTKFVDIGEAQFALIHLDRPQDSADQEDIDVLDEALIDELNAVDPGFLALNLLEAMGGPAS